MTELTGPEGFLERFGAPDPSIAPALGGAHPLSGPAPPDGAERNSHHVPAVALGKAIGKEYGDAKEHLSKGAFKDVDAAKKLIAKINTRITAVDGATKGRGKGLSAILLHFDTHKGADKGVHSTDGISETIEETDANSAEELRVKVRKKTKDQLAVNPQVKHWRGFIEACRKAVEDKIVDDKYETGRATKSILEKAEKVLASATDEFEDIEDQQLQEMNTAAGRMSAAVAKAVEDGYVNGAAAVKVALSASEKDGTKQERATALKSMKDTFNSSWAPIKTPIGTVS